MFLQYRDLKLIQTNNRPDEDNEAILRGDYLNKTPTYTEDGQEIPFVMPTRDETLKLYIFPEWQVGDILVIANQPLKHPKLQGDTLIEMTREEICATGDLSVLGDGEVYQNGKIIYKEKPEGVKIEWIYPNWVETATLEEQLEFYKQEILKVTAELSVYEKVGFTNDELQNKLNKLTQKHNDISFELANRENLNF